MYELKVKKSFSAAHFLRNYRGKCEKMHGHGYTVEVYLQGKRLNHIGYLVDFTEIKESLNRVIEQLDHGCLNELEAFAISNPTAENIARYIYNGLQNLNMEEIKISAVEVWETPEQSAKYLPD